jgi:prephenate dehydrogenase
MIERIAIVGMGLMGGSLARALRAARLAREIVGCGRSAASLAQAAQAGAIDRAEADVARAVHDADMVVLAVPVGATRELLARLAPALSPRAVVTDVGSVKASVLADARSALGAAAPRFVGGHPLAGGEDSGFSASRVDLYRGSRVILTPETDTDSAATAKVENMWRALGAEVVTLGAREHDEILARTSHLPHVLAFALMNMAARDPRALDFTGNGFRDMTRIAASDPAMWRDICLANRDALRAAAGELRAALDEILRAIEAGDAKEIEALFSRARTMRRPLGGVTP